MSQPTSRHDDRSSDNKPLEEHVSKLSWPRAPAQAGRPAARLTSEPYRPCRMSTSERDYTKCSLFRRIGVRQREGMLQDVVASVEDTEFEIEDALDKQLGSRPMPFPGMDSKSLS